MSELLGCWTCNLVIPGSSPPPCLSLELFSVAPISTPLLLNLAKCGGSFNKFNTYFLRSFDFSLFFRKWTFLQCPSRVSACG